MVKSVDQMNVIVKCGWEWTRKVSTFSQDVMDPAPEMENMLEITGHSGHLLSILNLTNVTAKHD